MKHRLFNRLRAEWGGYFWMPCPLCGQYMGGHEWRDVDGLRSSIPDPKYPKGSGRGIGICQDCTRAGKGYDEPMTVDDWCPTSWEDFHGTNRHVCQRPHALHKTPHRCGCGATLPVLRTSSDSASS